MIPYSIYEWVADKDCYGNPLIKEKEVQCITKRFRAIKDTLKIVQGDLRYDQPNTILIDITHLAPKGFQKGKKVLVTLSHHLRPCPCGKCKHQYQSECYLEDCSCCTDSCT